MSLLVLLILLLLSSDHKRVCVWSSIPKEAEALFQWKMTSPNKNNPFLASWNGVNSSSNKPCTWFGVSCHMGSNHISGLNLTNSSLSGTLLNFPFSSMRNIQNLDLSMNQLSGSVPKDLGNLTLLSHLGLDSNEFAGQIPEELGYLTQLRDLDLRDNKIRGSIPKSLGNLTNLTGLFFSGNQISGFIPEELGNMNMLRILDLSNNLLSGQIPSCLGNLTSLEFLFLFQNKLSGNIPPQLGNLTNLERLGLGYNSLSGSIAKRFQKLNKLASLALQFNQLIGQLPEHLCSDNQLQKITVDGNKLTGSIPKSLKNCTSLVRVRFDGNQFTGDVAEMFGVYPHLNFMDLSENKFHGELSSIWGKCKNLTTLRMAKNNITGRIPQEFGQLSKLGVLDLSSNHLTGEIPKEFGEFDSMLELYLQENHLQGTLPQELGLLTELLQLDISSNLLNGSLPESIGKHKKLTHLNLSNNLFTQEIPAELGDLLQLSQLDLGYNLLAGEIPPALANLHMLELLDLSHNQLSGQIPKGLADMSALSNVNLSFNNLEGPVPSGKSFTNIPINELQGNPRLCGNITGLQACKSPHSKKTSKKLVLVIMLPLLGLVTLLCISIAISFGCFGRKKLNADAEDNRTINNGNFFSISTFDGKEMYKKILESTEEFNEAYFIGEGGSGRVYKAQLSPTQVLAVKRLHALPNMGERNDFLNEIKALTVIRHRNIVRLHGFCSSDRHSFLIYEYLEKGSLASILATNESAVDLDLEKRLNIIKGVANALSYMHHDCSPPIVHRDISSKNILLDSDFEACVSDFGTAKFLKMDSLNQSSAGVVGTFGYMAPELAQSVKVTEKIDVFGFGVLTLEIIRGEHPRNHLAYPASETPVQVKLIDLIDKRIANPSAGTEKILASIFDLARQCVDENPVSRPTMQMVSNSLQLAGR